MERWGAGKVANSQEVAYCLLIETSDTGCPAGPPVGHLIDRDSA